MRINLSAGTCNCTGRRNHKYSASQSRYDSWSCVKGHIVGGGRRTPGWAEGSGVDNASQTCRQRVRHQGTPTSLQICTTRRPLRAKWWPRPSLSPGFMSNRDIHRVSKITVHFCFCQYFVKFETVNNVQTSYFTQLKICCLMTTFRCPSDILITSWLFTARWSTWPGNHLVPCVAELVGSCIPIHARRCLPDPKCLFYPSGLSLCLSVDHFCLVPVDDMVLFHGMVCDGCSPLPWMLGSVYQL